THSISTRYPTPSPFRSKARHVPAAAVAAVAAKPTAAKARRGVAARAAEAAEWAQEWVWAPVPWPAVIRPPATNICSPVRQDSTWSGVEGWMVRGGLHPSFETLGTNG